MVTGISVSASPAAARKVYTIKAGVRPNKDIKSVMRVMIWLGTGITAVS